MIDINTIVNTAIQQAINSAITNYVDAYMANVQQEHRNEITTLKAQIACMEEDLAKLKQQAATPSTTPNFTGQEVTALQLCITHETSPVYNAIVKIARDVASSVVEEVMDCHTEEYDHDSYDSAASAIEDANLDSLPDFDEFVKYDDLGSAIEDKLNEIVDMDEYVKEDDLPEFPDVDTLVTKDDLFDAVRESVRDTVENRVSVSLRMD